MKGFQGLCSQHRGRQSCGGDHGHNWRSCAEAILAKIHKIVVTPKKKVFFIFTKKNMYFFLLLWMCFFFSFPP